MEQGCYIVFRPRLGEIIVTNMKEENDITMTQQQIDEWYADGEKKARIQSIKDELDSLNKEGLGFLLDGNQQELDRINAQRILLQNELESLQNYISAKASNIYNNM